MGPKKNNKPKKGEKIGKLILKCDASSVTRKHVSQLADAININGFRWQLVNGLFISKNVKAILRETQELNINHLGLTKNQHPLILLDLNIFPLYHKLQNLIICNNRIESLEPIANLNAPVLWRIDVRENQIFSVETLSKVRWPNLNMLVIGNNRVNSIEGLSRSHLPIVGWIDLEQNPNLFDIKQVCKLPVEQLNHLYLRESGFIEKQFRKSSGLKSEYQCLLNKWPKMHSDLLEKLGYLQEKSEELEMENLHIESQ